jgi:hypothetical protein
LIYFSVNIHCPGVCILLSRSKVFLYFVFSRLTLPFAELLHWQPVMIVLWQPRYPHTPYTP